MCPLGGSHKSQGIRRVHSSFSEVPVTKGRAEGRVWRWCSPPEVSGEDCSQTFGVCLIRSLPLRPKLWRHANRIISQKDWVCFSSRFVPWGWWLVKKNFSICYSVGPVSVSPVGHQNQVIKGCPLGAATKTWVPGMSTNSFLGDTRKEAEGEVEDGSNQPL